MDKRTKDHGIEVTKEPQPTPVQWLRLLEWSEEHRRIWCIEYEECLDRAILGRWEGWSCCSCKVRKEWRPSLNGEETLTDTDLECANKRMIKRMFKNRTMKGGLVNENNY